MAEKQPETMGASLETGEIKVVTFESLQEKFKDKAASVYDEISQIGGWGTDYRGTIGGRPVRDIQSLRDLAENANDADAKKDAKERLSKILKLLK